MRRVVITNTRKLERKLILVYFTKKRKKPNLTKEGRYL